MLDLHSIRSLALASAPILLAACGGGGDDTADAAAALAAMPAPSAASTPGNAADSDDADPATRAAIARVFESIDDASTERMAAPLASSSRSGGAGASSRERSGRIQARAYPGVKDTRLVANKPEYGAPIVEPDLKNPWGIAIRPAGFGGHWWLGAAGTGKSIQYVGDVGDTPLFQDELKVVDTGGPVTGVVFNPGKQFVITQAHPNGPITNATKFLFANLSGTITAWTERARAGGGFDHPADSVTVVDGRARGSSFIGVAVSPAADQLYAADFGADAALRVYDGSFAEVGTLANPFQAGPMKVPGGFEAFNVQTIDQRIFAMYGRHVPRDPNQAPPAEGRLAEFDANGKLVAKWLGRGTLNYPWGVARAPKNFGLYGGCLLIGNFGDGTIVAFHPRLKVALDYVRDESGKKIVIDGLWGLQFGNGASLGEADHLYYAAGPNREQDGLFGKLEVSDKVQGRLGAAPVCR